MDNSNNENNQSHGKFNLSYDDPNVKNATPDVDVNALFGVEVTSKPQASPVSETNQNVQTEQQNNNNSINSSSSSYNSVQQKPVDLMPVRSKKSQSNGQQINNNQADDNELLKAYIGDNYEKITNKIFNFSAFFFTSLYMFYRKMYIFATLTFIVNLIFVNFVKMNPISFVFYLVVGFISNFLYIYHSERKISKIKKANPEKNEEELKQICSSKGGTSIGSVFVGFAIQIIIILLFMLIMLILGITTIFSNLFSSINSSVNGVYEGTIVTDTNINIKDEFSIEVPSKFKDESDTYEYNYKFSSETDVFDKCEVEFSSPVGYKDSENLLNQMADYEKDSAPSEVVKTSSNGIDWYTFSVNDSFGKTYYYGTTKDNKVYLLQYNVNKDTSSDCETYREKIINSIRKK